MDVLILSNSDVGLYKFRKELIRTLNKEHNVTISIPEGPFFKTLQEEGSACLPVQNLSRHGMNPLKELQLLHEYFSLIKQVNPDVVLTYTIKPNIYGGIASRMCHVPYLVNVTGLGRVYQKEGLLSRLVSGFYSLSLKNAETVYFQNQNDMQKLKSRLHLRNEKLLPGSGVNLGDYEVYDYPDNDVPILLYLGRLEQNKGTTELLEAAEMLKDEPVKIWLVGDVEDPQIKAKIKELEEREIVRSFGFAKDVRPYLQQCDGLINPSYHEGLSNVLLEAAACGRPVLASDIPGCRETFRQGISGLGFAAQNSQALYSAIKDFLAMPKEQRKAMGLNGRRHVEENFDRNLIINEYVRNLNSLNRG